MYTAGDGVSVCLEFVVRCNYAGILDALMDAV